MPARAHDVNQIGVDGRRRLWVALIALLLGALGFAGGGLGAAWVARDARSKPWRALRIEHAGVAGSTTRTRAIFDNPKLPLQGIEVIRNPEGAAELGRVEVRGGSELTVRYGDDERPSALEGPDGSEVLISYGGSQARVTFVAADDKVAGERVVRVPVALRSALRLSLDVPWIDEAYAQAGAPEEDPQINVQREVALRLDVAMPASKGAAPGEARVEASCPPYSCVPLTPAVSMPGQADVRVAVSAAQKKSSLPAPASPSALDAFSARAADERETAAEVLPAIAMVAAVVGVTAQACAALGLAWPQCVPAMAKDETAGAASYGIASHDIRITGPEAEQRKTELYYEEQARAALDKPVRIEVCLSRSGYTRACTEIQGRPLGAAPMAETARRLELRRGISGTVEGSFVMTQADGGDCRFSPSPRTTGPLSLSFDDKTGTVTAKLSANERGTRVGLRCSLGSGDMRWSQAYSATLTQRFSKEQLQGGGVLSLNMSGTMSGSGSSSQSNCRASSGAAAACPGGRSDSYNYPIRLVGSLDLDNQTGNGSLQVDRAPLSTGGSWQVPPAKKSP